MMQAACGLPKGVAMRFVGALILGLFPLLVCRLSGSNDAQPDDASLRKAVTF
jgi:hypothetical protein